MISKCWLDEMHAVTCDACKHRFHLLIAECESCGDETVLTWTSGPDAGQIGHATCVHCGNRLNDHADDIRTMVAGR